MTGYTSGLCAHARHGHCRGDFGTVSCDCGCHTAPEVLRIGELFAGYGGLGMGVTAALGGEVAWVSEYEPPSKANPKPSQAAARILAHRYPGVPNHGDITRIDWAAVEPVDVLTGGSPCQDLSHAGKRGGMTDGTRSNLWVSMREAIAQLRPGLVVWENVRGAYSAPADSELESREGRLGVVGDGPVLRALGRVLGDLSSLGFDAEWVGLRAADVGAPHGRFRVFVVAWPAADAERGGRDGRPGTPGPGRRPEPARLLGGPHAAVGGDAPAHTGGHRRQGHPERDQWPAGRFAAPRRDDADRRSDAHADASSGRGSDQPECGGPAGLDVGALAGPGGGDRPGNPAEGVHLVGGTAPELAWGPYGAAVHRWERRLGRPAPAPTEPGTKGQPRLSPRFVEWLMGLPAGWVCDVPGLSRNDQLKALGNGVVPAQAAAALRLLLPAAVEDVA